MKKVFLAILILFFVGVIMTFFEKESSSDDSIDYDLLWNEMTEKENYGYDIVFKDVLSAQSNMYTLISAERKVATQITVTYHRHSSVVSDISITTYAFSGNVNGNFKITSNWGEILYSVSEQNGISIVQKYNNGEVIETFSIIDMSNPIDMLEKKLADMSTKEKYECLSVTY